MGVLDRDGFGKQAQGGKLVVPRGEVQRRLLVGAFGSCVGVGIAPDAGLLALGQAHLGTVGAQVVGRVFCFTQVIGAFVVVFVFFAVFVIVMMAKVEIGFLDQPHKPYSAGRNVLKAAHQGHEAQARG